MLAVFVALVLFSTVFADEPSPFSPCNYTASFDVNYGYCHADFIIYPYVLSRSVADNGEVIYKLKHDLYRKISDDNMFTDPRMAELHTPGEGRELKLDLTPGSRYPIYGNLKGGTLYATYCQQDVSIRRRDNPSTQPSDIRYDDNSLYTYEEAWHGGRKFFSTHVVDPEMRTQENYPNLCDKFKQ